MSMKELTDKASVRSRYSGRQRRKRKQRKFGIPLPVDVYDAVADAAYLYDVSMTQILRAAVRDWLKRHYRKEPFSL